MLVNILYGTYGNYTYWNEDDQNVPVEGESWDRGDAINSEDGRPDDYVFDVVAIDYQMLIDDAFSALSVFATDYSGSTLSTEIGNEIPLGHVTGYKNDEVNTLIAEAYAAKAARAKGYKATVSEKLHAVEAKLLEEMPVIPIFVYKDAVLIHDDLSDIEFNFFGGPCFNDVSLKNWEDYIEEEVKEDDKKR
jgi:ABC-type transport system substrate-binding protein